MSNVMKMILLSLIVTIVGAMVFPEYAIPLLATVIVIQSLLLGAVVQATRAELNVMELTVTMAHIVAACSYLDAQSAIKHNGLQQPEFWRHDLDSILSTCAKRAGLTSPTKTVF